MEFQLWETFWLIYLLTSHWITLGSAMHCNLRCWAASGLFRSKESIMPIEVAIGFCLLLLLPSCVQPLTFHSERSTWNIKFITTFPDPNYVRLFWRGGSYSLIIDNIGFAYMFKLSFSVQTLELSLNNFNVKHWLWKKLSNDVNLAQVVLNCY